MHIFLLSQWNLSLFPFQFGIIYGNRRKGNSVLFFPACGLYVFGGFNQVNMIKFRVKLKGVLINFTHRGWGFGKFTHRGGVFDKITHRGRVF